jgi:hypothetical protein
MLLLLLLALGGWLGGTLVFVTENGCLASGTSDRDAPSSLRR